MTQQNEQKQRGFTLIELVVVIAILAILAAFALPRFAQLSQQAHDSSVKATTGALAAGVALLKTQWVSNGFTSAQQNVVGFGNDVMDVSAEGWATASDDALDHTSAAMTVDKCQQVWEGLLQANAPSVVGTNPDYEISIDTGDCIYTYQLDGQGTTIEYDADTGEVTNDL